MMKKIAMTMMAAVVALSVAGCAKSANAERYGEPFGAAPKGGYAQLNEPKSGDPIAIMETSMGTIKIRLFPEYAPKTVENFTTLAEDGYYDGITFHRVQDNFMIQGGDPNGNGTGGRSKWGTPFEDEFTPQLHNIRGALSMANSGPNTNGSQFFIVQSYDAPPEYVEYFRSVANEEGEWFDGTPIKASDLYQEEFNKVYEEQGGAQGLDYVHSVFGQVYEGMDVVDAIANVETTFAANGEQSKPVEDVVILSVTIGKY